MILAGQSEHVAAWVISRVRDPIELPGGYEAIGALDQNGQLIGGWIYTNYREHDIQICAAGSGNWLTRGNLREFFGYPFNQLGCIRITAAIAKANKLSREISERLGFRLEGTLRHGLAPNRDLLLYGMLKEDCKWIN
jgi:RimJ/RimL family protein N-acetyltransferase